MFYLLMISMPLLASDDIRVSASGSEIIDVEHPQTWIQNEKLSIQYSLSARSIFAGEMLMLVYHLETNDAFISLRIENKPAEGEEYIALKTLKRELADTSDMRYSYELRVLYSSVRSGEHQLRIPELVYSEGGRDAYRFRFTEQTIQVKPLPPYLPPYIALQDTQISSSISANSSWYNPLETGRVYYWNIILTARNASLLTMPEIARQLSSNKNIKLLPAEISRTTEKHHDFLIQQVSYNIPFSINKSGYFSLPAISLRYFDTQKGRLISSQYTEDYLFSLNTSMRWLIIVGTLLLCAYFLNVITTSCMRICRQLRILHLGRKQIRGADTAQQIRRAMQLLGKSLGWPENIGLIEWSRKWNLCMGEDKSMDVNLQLLGRKLYSQHPQQGELFIGQNILKASRLQLSWYCIRNAVK